MTRKEAIDILISTNIWNDEEMTAWKVLVPELKENEDEKIRKQLVNIVAFIPEANFKSASREDCRTYLEKQKEQKPSVVEKLREISTPADENWFEIQKRWEKEDEDERIIRFFAELATDACGGPGQEYYEELGLNYDKVMTWLEKQKEQKKPVDYDHEMWKNCEANFEGGKKEVIEHPEKYGLTKQKPADLTKMMVHKEPYIAPVPIPMVADEQKPVEWSDDFEQNIRILLHDKLTWHSDDGKISTAVFIDDKTMKDIVTGIWFYVGKEAMKNPNTELPKQEWSEEDEIHRNFILESLEDQIRFCKKDAEGAYYAKQIRTAQNWLKYLKPHWKPSEEQIKAIRLARSFVVDDFDEHPTLSEILMELEEQLKRLM